MGTKLVEVIVCDRAVSPRRTGTLRSRPAGALQRIVALWPILTSRCPWLRRGAGPLPGGRFLRGLCAALDTDGEYLLGLDPGRLIPAELLVDPQGELGLLWPDEEMRYWQFVR